MVAASRPAGLDRHRPAAALRVTLPQGIAAADRLQIDAAAAAGAVVSAGQAAIAAQAEQGCGPDTECFGLHRPAAPGRLRRKRQAQWTGGYRRKHWPLKAR